MAELLHVAAVGADSALVTVMNLYCWQHKANHLLPLAEVERLVYALGVDGWDRGPGADRVAQGDFVPACPLDVVKNWAGDPEIYAEWVEQGVECRAVAGEWTP